MTCYTYLGHIRNPRIYAVPPQLRGFYAILLSSQKPRKMGGLLYNYNGMILMQTDIIIIKLKVKLKEFYISRNNKQI